MPEPAHPRDPEDIPPEIREIGEILARWYTPGGMVAWLTTPAPVFGFDCAATLIKGGRAEEVLRLLRQLDESAYL